MRFAIIKTQKLPQNFIVFFCLLVFRGGDGSVKGQKKGIEFIIKLAEIIVITALIK